MGKSLYHPLGTVNFFFFGDVEKCITALLASPCSTAGLSDYWLKTLVCAHTNSEQHSNTRLGPSRHFSYGFIGTVNTPIVLGLSSGFAEHNKQPTDSVDEDNLLLCGGSQHQGMKAQHQFHHQGSPPGWATGVQLSGGCQQA